MTFTMLIYTQLKMQNHSYLDLSFHHGFLPHLPPSPTLGKVNLSVKNVKVIPKEYKRL